MFFTFLMLLFTVVVFFAVKAKTFDRLRPWSRLTVVGVVSLVTATIFTMQFFISIRKTLIAFLEAIQGVPLLVVGGVFVVLVVLVFPLIRLLGRMDLEQLKRYWHEDIRPRQKRFVHSLLELVRTFTWDRTKSLFSRARPDGDPNDPEDLFSRKRD